MSKDYNDIYKKIDQSHKELYKKDSEISKDQEKMIKDIAEIKREIKDITFKVDTMLDILNNFTIMLAEDDEDLEENYDIEDSDESWIPQEKDFWEDDNDESV
jgi:hypothetical protein